MRRQWVSWAVFIVFGGMMGFLRYGRVLPSAYLSMFKTYGPWIVLGVYVCLILFAFKDTIYQGILCVLVPLYAFYYLFVLSDAFLVRALVGGLLVGVGQDSAIFFQNYLTEIVDNVRRWIASGG